MLQKSPASPGFFLRHCDNSSANSAAVEASFVPVAVFWRCLL